MRYPKNERLSKLAHRLHDIEFDGFDRTQAALRSLIMRGGAPKNSYQIFNRFEARLFLGGQQFTVGISQSAAKTARFADAARVYFWPYRNRRSVSLSSQEFNFSIEQAQSDLDNNVDVRALLDAFRDELVTLNAIPAHPAVDARTLQADELQYTIATCRRVVSVFLSELKRIASPGRAAALVGICSDQATELNKSLLALAGAFTGEPKTVDSPVVQRRLEQIETLEQAEAQRKSNEKLIADFEQHRQRTEVAQEIARQAPHGLPYPTNAEIAQHNEASGSGLGAHTCDTDSFISILNQPQQPKESEFERAAKRMQNHTA